MTPEQIAPCPCGKTPEKLSITDAGQGGKWACVSGWCCGEWEIEFRTDYQALDSEECMKNAIQAWNETERGWLPLITQLQEQVTELENHNKDKSQLLANYKEQITALVKEKHRREE